MTLQGLYRYTTALRLKSNRPFGLHLSGFLLFMFFLNFRVISILISSYVSYVINVPCILTGNFFVVDEFYYI